jgi:hypothetical protein
MSDTLKATAEQYDSLIAQLNEQIGSLSKRLADVTAARKAIDPALQAALASESGGDNAANTPTPRPAKSNPQSS